MARKSTTLNPTNSSTKKEDFPMKRISRRNFMKIVGAGAAALGLAACGGSKSESAASTAASQFTGEAVTATYPLANGDKTLNIYIRNATSGVVQNYHDIKAFQVAEENLGVNLAFTHPAVGSESDQFNLMIASGEYPDVIIWSYSTSPMGVDELIDEGVLIDMDSCIRQYAPNYLAAVDTPAHEKEVLSNSGTYQGIYCFTLGVPVSSGPSIRADLLEKYGLDVPVTVDDWENVMATIRDNEPGVTYPFTTYRNYIGNANLNLLLPAYKTSTEFCSDGNGGVVFGPSTDNYRQFVTKLNDWYNKGLLDPEFMSNDSAANNAKLVNGSSIASVLSLNSGIGNVTTTARASNPDFELVGVAWPVLNEGDTPCFHLDGGVAQVSVQAVVTSSCADPALATQVLDYFFSEEGNNLLCWGIEGESYTVNADGSKTFTDAVMNNPEGKTPSEAVLAYALPSYGFVNPMDEDAYMQITLTMPEQVEARTLWHSLDQGVCLPQLTIAPEHQNDYNMIMNEVDTYVQEMLIRFVTGQSNIDESWDTYVNTLNGMGLDVATQYMTDAYNAFQQR